jgi:hypothetical protein
MLELTASLGHLGRAEGDIKACYDLLSQPWLLEHVPMDRELLRKWLGAGFLEKHAWFATTEGTPQGGIISPVLANRALDGLQRLLAERFMNTPGRQRRHKVHPARYADDFMITGTSKVLLGYEVQPLVEQFLKGRGLELSREKTRITHIEDGFDFLGQTIRRYPCGTVLLKPSRGSVKTSLAKIRETIDNSGSMTAGEMIWRLNQRIKGWTMYHRHAASGAAWAAATRQTTWSCCTPTATGRSTHGRTGRLMNQAASCKGRSQRLEPDASQDARPVLRGGGAGDSAPLPDPSPGTIGHLPAVHAAPPDPAYPLVGPGQPRTSTKPLPGWPSTLRAGAPGAGHISDGVRRRAPGQ